MTERSMTALQVKNLSQPGTYAVGKPPGLSLRVRPSTAVGAEPGRVVKQWVLRYMLDGTARMMGLGSFPDLSLEQARKAAQEIRSQQIKLQGVDPLTLKAERKEAQRKHREWLKKRKTFRQCAEEYIATQQASWRNEKHRDQWSNTLATYAYPVLGDIPVDEIATSHVLSVLQPIWIEKNETAMRLRGRMENVLDWAKAHGLRTGDNPAASNGNMRELLPKISRKARIKHHPALPYSDIAPFMGNLRRQSGVAARALEFAILTSCRTGEVIGARWEEVDLQGKQWIIPAERMKGKREHRVPLSDRAVEILQTVGTTADVVFPSPRGKTMCNMALLAVLKRMGYVDTTVHGFRSTFRDWAGECTSHAREVVEHALAHGLKDQTEAAYARGTLMQKRRDLMQEWADACTVVETDQEVADGQKL